MGEKTIELTCFYCDTRFTRSCNSVANRRKWGKNRFFCSATCTRQQNKQDIGFVDHRKKR